MSNPGLLKPRMQVSFSSRLLLTGMLNTTHKFSLFEYKDISFK
jgi:hypothetical protein